MKINVPNPKKIKNKADLLAKEHLTLIKLIIAICCSISLLNQ